MQLDLHWTNLNDLVNRTHNFMINYLNSHAVKFEFAPDDQLPNILGDPKQIEQVMRNIVINAVQAMSEGGTITVTSGHQASHETVTVIFSDTGVGIAEDRLDEIFQPFVTSKTKGTGLGLPIVRKIVENHGGSIDVSSRVGEGASFIVTFPIRPMVTEPPARTQIVAAAAQPPTIPDV
jgi:signal transduction histidine kinase